MEQPYSHGCYSPLTNWDDPPSKISPWKETSAAQNQGTKENTRTIGHCSILAGPSAISGVRFCTQLSNIFALQVSAKLSACSHCDLLYGRKCSLRFKQLLKMLVDQRFERFFSVNPVTGNTILALPLISSRFERGRRNCSRMCFGLSMTKQIGIMILDSKEMQLLW